MTEKRFIIIGDSNIEFIMQTQLLLPIYDNKERLNLKTCCDLLNKLHEENEQLKNDCSILIQSNQDYRKENERLKSQLYCDDEEGICNICKHHYLVSNDEAELGYYSSRCKKGHYECARISLKHCEDFEKKDD